MVFAPTNEAFAALPAGTVEDLLKPENKATLANILLNHVTPGNYSKDFLKKFKKLGQANNQSVKVEVIGDDVFVGGAKIIASVPAGSDERRHQREPGNPGRGQRQGSGGCLEGRLRTDHQG